VLLSPLKNPDDVSKLNFGVNCKEFMSGTLQAITLTRKMLKGKVPLLGFVGAPVRLCLFYLLVYLLDLTFVSVSLLIISTSYSCSGP